MWQLSSNCKKGSISSSSGLPSKVEQLFCQLVEEYEALQSENATLRDELYITASRHSSRQQQQQQTQTFPPSVSSSIVSVVPSSPVERLSNRLSRRPSMSVFNSTTEAKSFTMNPNKVKRRASRAASHHDNVCTAIAISSRPESRLDSRRSSIASTHTTSSAAIGSSTHTASSAAIGSGIMSGPPNGFALTAVPELPANVLSNDLMSQLPGKLPVIHSVETSLATSDQIRTQVPPSSLDQLSRNPRRASTEPAMNAAQSIFESWKISAAIGESSDDATAYESQDSKSCPLSPTLSPTILSHMSHTQTLQRSATGNLVPPEQSAMIAEKIRSFTQAVDAPGSAFQEVPSLRSQGAPQLMSRVPGYFGLLRTVSSGILGPAPDSLSTAASFLRAKTLTFATGSRNMLSPIGQTRLAWDLLICMCFTGDIWTSLFSVCFLEENSTPIGMVVIAVFITVCFFVDIVVNFNTSTIDGCVSGKAIAIRYIGTWFWFDIIASIPWSAFLPRVTSLIRLIRIAKMIKMPSFSYLWYVLRRKGRARLPFILTIAFAIWLLFAHVHACLWQLARNERKAVDFDDAVSLYYDSFWWAFLAFADGSSSATEAWPRFLEILVAAERFVFLALAGGWSIFQLAVFYKDPVHVASLMDDALSYMRQHRVGALTQLKVARTIRDVTEGRSARENFYELVTQLPGDLRQAISKEMWKGPLISLELISIAAEWHPSFITKLLMIIGEEAIPPGAILCQEGETQKVACKIMSGKLAVITKVHHLPDLQEGMWFGENALVNPYLLSSGTASAKMSTMLMSIPVPEFHHVLTDLELSDQFKHECAERLWRGLCGRCGAFGDHFANECHTLMHKRPTKQLSHLGRHFTSTFSTGSRVITPRRDLQEFLLHTKLTQISPTLSRMHIRSLQDFEKAMRTETSRAEILEDIPEERRDNVTPDKIVEFCRHAADQIREKIEMSTPKKCLIFLSHYKVEAGTEAALMRAELELLIDKDPRQLGRYFEVPVFLDSENLTDLDALQQHVVESHNLVLMLTKGVLTRPWVLVEIVTASRNGVPIIPVQIVKPEAEFEFPCDEFYAQLTGGHFLDQDAMQVLKECRIDLQDLEKAIRSIFKRIAVRYSPHRAASIRKAELEAVLREVALRKAPVL